MQFVLPLSVPDSRAREDFIVAAGNAQAVAFIDSWPRWPVGIAALHGPRGCGKTHLASIWEAASGARRVPIDALDATMFGRPLVVEDVDSEPPTEPRDTLLFRAMENASLHAPLLMTGEEEPARWPTVLPDLASRFSATLGLPLWTPDDGLLGALARKLLADRQLTVPPAIVERMITSLERSPESIRKFIAMADAKALSESRPFNLALVRQLIAEWEGGAP